MDVEVVHDQMDGVRLRVCRRQADGNLSELEARAVRSREGEMAARLWLYGTENIGSPAPLVFVVPPRFPSWHGWRKRPQVGVQSNRLLIQTDHRLPADHKAVRTLPDTSSILAI